ncbi:MAG: DUF4124 domain-containing protein [Halothiobacillaceae bacterium]
MKSVLWSLLLLCLLPALVSAQTVYRVVDDNGNVTFTDQPVPGATPMAIDPSPPMELVIPRMPERSPSREPAGEERGAYDHLAISAPANGAVIEARLGGVLLIELAIEPTLAPSDRITIYLDDRPVVSDSSGTRHAVSDIPPGRHQIFFEIRREGEVVARSPDQTFEFRIP